jgi:hypothetical protein
MPQKLTTKVLCMSYKKISQIVDTIKLHFYHGDETTSKMLLDYTNKIAQLADLKTDAFAIKHSNNDMRFVDYNLGSERFRVMATTVRGFSVTLQNNDVSISFKTVSQKQLKGQYPKDYDENSIVETPIQPVVRVEFRASYLARVGHKTAINYVVKLIEKHFLQSYRIKVAELHLATDIQGYNFHHLDYHRFRTRKSRGEIHDQENKNDSFYYQGRKFTGFVLGGGDDMLRIYNKTVEIKKFPDKEFIKHFVWEHNPDYIPNVEVWRIEIQYRREKLKTIYDSEHGLLDGFENVLASIPSLWDRALEKVTMIDLDDSKCIEHYLGYVESSMGVKLPIEANTIRMRIQRAVIHPLWLFLKGWKDSIGNKTSVHNAPKTGAFRWVSNSIKSLLSTSMKHYGELSPKNLEDAFLRADEEIMKDKSLTLVDNAVNNALDYFGAATRYATETGVVVRDSLSTLQKNLSAYVREITRNLFDVYGTHDDFAFSRARILNKSLQRAF